MWNHIAIHTITISVELCYTIYTKFVPVALLYLITGNHQQPVAVCFTIAVSNFSIFSNTGESPALGRRILWANRLFSKSMKGKILNFLHEVEKIISVISVQV